MAASGRDLPVPRAATTWYCRPATASCNCCSIASTVGLRRISTPPCPPTRERRTSDAIYGPPCPRGGGGEGPPPGPPPRGWQRGRPPPKNTQKKGIGQR